ncbi:glycoside hydrolase family 10 protein [Mangrovibacterium lignilyticum]|uniref:glycoside hydrolase family 10 protein n=1 Tax=Mangrovibacterium lignilyticum TaxID=2668052 RepID=UPI001EE5C2FF|nr:family 10 glycosylhydrolase [Mangrovibacterium lignilyticum]
MRKYTLLLTLLLCAATFVQARNQPKYEFRAAWVATVNNIDWPSQSGLTVQEQKAEAIDLLDLMVKNGLNAVIFQIRPTSDAFYPSTLEPWSRYLTGTPGKDPGYDPLKFWIDECHKRHMEFHAWMNPFRVAQKADEPLAASHIAFKHPEWIIKYGGKLYFNPALDETRQFIVQVVKDVVSRYDIDAIHMDDYFYPYPVAGEAFPDVIQFTKNPRHFNADQLEDWRRNNVDLTIQLISKTIKETKPWVKFGISPFGVWRNIDKDARGSMTKAGVSNYDDLYADILKWLQYGWIDYVTPQLYWRIGHPAVNYITLLDWWSKNGFNRDVYIGHGLYKIDAKSSIPEWTDPNQVPKQIEMTRENPNVHGSVLFSAIQLKRNLLGLQDTLQHQLYNYTALTPSMPWIDFLPPNKPVKFNKRGRKLKWEKPAFKNEMDEVKRYIVYKNKVGEQLNEADVRSIYTITDGTAIKLERRKGKKERFEFRVTALDRLNNESSATLPETIKW